MARTESVLTVFLASPGDLADERLRVEEVFMDWNRMWSRNLGVRLDLLRWEDDAYPGIGVDTQDVINQQIPADYDLFIGVMWSRFGTPTGRAASGTEEEFQRALARHRSAPGELSIFFYFKDTPIPPSRVDPAQLLQVQRFKASLGNEGLLYWDFTDTDQFEKLISLHITKHVQQWRHKERPQVTQLTGSAERAPSSYVARDGMEGATELPSADDAHDDDAGYLDLLEVFSERIAEVNNIATRLTEAQQELSIRTTQGSQDLKALSANPQTATPAHARRLIGKVAEEMLSFTNRVNAEVPLLRAAMDSSIRALTRAATLSLDFDPEQFRSAQAAAGTMLTAIAGARISMAEFRVTTVSLPRMTKELNAAKRKQAAALDDLVAEFEKAERLLAEAIDVIGKLM